jgi:hypothetical protein
MGFQRQKVCDLHGKDVRNVCQPENPAATIPGLCKESSMLNPRKILPEVGLPPWHARAGDLYAFFEHEFDGLAR